MLEPPREPEQTSGAKFLRYSWFVVAAVFLFVGGIVFLRWHQNRSIELEMERRATEKQAEEDRQTLESMGGNRFEILAFYASPASIGSGEKDQLYYGVSNAVAVRLDPAVESLRPSFTRCLKCVSAEGHHLYADRGRCPGPHKNGDGGHSSALGAAARWAA